MKKIGLLFLVFISLFLFSCNDKKEENNNESDNTEEIDDLTESEFDAIIKNYSLPKSVYQNINFENSITNNDYVINLSYLSSNTDIITNNGEINPLKDKEKDVTVSVTFSYKDFSKTRNYDICVLSKDDIFNLVKSDISLNSDVMDFVNFKESSFGFPLIWQSFNKRIIKDNGEILFSDTINTCNISCEVEIFNESYWYDIELNVLPWSFEKRISNIDFEKLVPSETIFNLDLKSELDYGIKCIWTSSDESVISSDGNVYHTSKNECTLNLKAYLNDNDSVNHVYNIKVNNLEGERAFYEHNFKDYSYDFNENNMNNLKKNGKYVELCDNCLSGSYESEEISTYSFYELVGSFSCITDTNSSCELQIKVRCNDSWSKYISYGVFSLGKQSNYSNDSDSLAKLSTDEFLVLNKNANGFKYKINLKRNNLSNNSPKLLMVSLCLFMNKGYTYIPMKNMPNYIDFQTPELNQCDVPNIGSIICSATTTTMLLNRLGFDFKNKGYTYEHEYIASLVKTNGIYGNWTYNMAVAGAMGTYASVDYVTSFEEVKEYLNKYGSIGASIKGYFGYETAGHLIVVRGYRVDGNGNTTVIVNDPYNKYGYGICREVSLKMFEDCFRDVIYVIREVK